MDKCPKCESTDIVDDICQECGLNVAQWMEDNPVCGGCGERHPVMDTAEMMAKLRRLIGMPEELPEPEKTLVDDVLQAADGIDDAIATIGKANPLLLPDSETPEFIASATAAAVAIAGAAFRVDEDTVKVVNEVSRHLAVLGAAASFLKPEPMEQETRELIMAHSRIALVLGIDAGRSVTV